MPPLVSVIIPTRNRPETLVRALKSVLSQTYTALEVCVVDDASSPPVEVPSTLMNDPRIKIVRLETNHGAAGARNVGVGATSGPLLAFLDDDDEWLPNKTARQVKVLSNQSDDVAGTECGYQVWEKGQLTAMHLPAARRDLSWELFFHPVTGAWSVLMRRDVFEELGGFDESLERHEDWDLWLRLVERYDLIPLEEAHVRRWTHDDVPAQLRRRAYQEIFQRQSSRVQTLPVWKRLIVRAWHGRVMFARTLEVFATEWLGRDSWLRMRALNHMIRDAIRRVWKER